MWRSVRIRNARFGRDVVQADENSPLSQSLLSKHKRKNSLLDAGYDWNVPPGSILEDIWESDDKCPLSGVRHVHTS